ncbi:MAG: TetR/AcrR family transcriptional regulator [Sporichthyaceae bacterium]
MPDEKRVGEAVEPGPRRRMPRAQRESAMLDAAEALFGEHGYAAASMDEIAAQVGVSKPMLYHYYGSKERLFLACLRRARTSMREAILAGAAAGESAQGQLYSAFVAWFTYIDAHPAIAAMLIDEALFEVGSAAEEIEAIRDEHMELIAVLIAAHAPPGHIGDPTEIEVIAAAVAGVGERVTRWRTRHPELTPQRTARHLMQLLWLGMGAMAAGEVWEAPGTS